MVNIVSCNVNGIRNKMKRHSIFKEFQDMQGDIFLLQETFITREKIKEFKNDWDGEFMYTPGTNHSLGNIILMKKGFIIQNQIIMYEDERIFCFQFTHDEELLMFTSLMIQMVNV